jgi:hypothetical protein
MQGTFSDEDWSVLCSAATHWLESCKTHDHVLQSRLRLPQPEGPGSHIYIPQEQGGPVTPSGTGFPLCRFLYLAVLWWRYLTRLHMSILSRSGSWLHYD